MSPDSGSNPRLAGALVHAIGGVVGLAWILEALGSHRLQSAGLALYWGVQAVAWAGFVWVYRCPPQATRLLQALLLWSVVFRLIAAGTNPLMENDHARHLWDGWRTWTTGNPYSTPPTAFFRDPTVPEALQSVLSEINYPDIPTIYAPVLQGWCALAAALQPGALWPFKSFLVAADLLILLRLWREVSPRAAVLYGWCPLVIHETSANAHAEVLAILPLFAAWLAFRSDRPVRGGFWLGLAVATKVTALLAVPFLLPVKNWRAGLACAATALVPYLPFWIQGIPGEWDGLRRFAGDWEFNSSVVGLLELVVPPVVAKAIAGTMALILLASLIWKWRTLPVADRRLDWVFGIPLALSAVVNPWYLLWMAPFAAVWASSRSAWVVWSATASISLSYATTLNLGLPGTEPFLHPVWVRPVEYGLILAALFVAALIKVRNQTTPTLQ